MSPLKSVSRGQRVWDVDNGEAHVHATIDAWKNQKPARLSPAQYDRLFAYLWGVLWQLSGFTHDWKTGRYVWELRGFIPPSSPGDEFKALRPLQFVTEERARRAVQVFAERGTPLVLWAIERTRPRGAYDPSFGQSFSTYSRRILVMRIADWYRTDPEFGDNRYGSRPDHEESLEGLGERLRHDNAGDDNSFLDRHSPGSRLDFVDDLNRHAYQESLEEVLTREAVSR